MIGHSEGALHAAALSADGPGAGVVLLTGHPITWIHTEAAVARTPRD